MATAAKGIDHSDGCREGCCSLLVHPPAVRWRNQRQREKRREEERERMREMSIPPFKLSLLMGLFSLFGALVLFIGPSLLLAQAVRLNRAHFQALPSVA